MKQTQTSAYFLGSLEHRYPRRRMRQRGITLVEMLVVLVIISILFMLVAPTMEVVKRGSALTSGGNMVVNMASLARQTAISKNTLSALVVLGALNSPDDHRMLTVLHYDAEIGWLQTGKWERLPPGVVIDFQDGASTFLQNTQPFPFCGGDTKLPIPYMGHDVPVGAYAARIFLSNGVLQNPEHPAQLRLVQARINGNRLDYGSIEDGEVTNYYDVAILGMTGMAKVSRP